MTPPTAPRMLQHLSTGALALGLLLSAVAARAQSPADVPRLEDQEAEDWPEMAWISFVDDPVACAEDVDCDCDPVEARDGLCVEEVTFDPLLAAQRSGNVADGPTRLRAMNTSDLFHWLWEDLAWQLTEPDSPAAEHLVPLGVTRPDALSSSWDSTPLRHDDRDRATFVALPEHSAALTEASWFGAPGSPTQLFAPVRYMTAPGTEPQPSLVLLSGRFASRLGYEGRRLTCDDGDCDVLDLGADTAGPFYEQLYPFRRERMADVSRARPLGLFLAADGQSSEASEAVRRPGVPLEGDGISALEVVAADQFTAFTRLVGSRVTEFGMMDHTVNQMRVFTALTAMSYPPGELESATGITRDLVAAALGQTDDESEALSRLESDPMAIQESFDLRYDQLPESLVNAWVDDLLALTPEGAPWPGGEYWAALRRDVDRDVQDLFRPGVNGLTEMPRGLSDAELEAWLRPSLREAVNVKVLAQEVRYRALVRLLERLPDADDDNPAGLPTRDRVETWLLLDHLHQSFADTFDANSGMSATPEQVTTAGADQWRATLGRHGITSVPIGQGLGAVDPVSICTTKDGRAALNEPAFGAIDVDLLLAAEDGSTDAREVLWERREDLPFLAVDHPGSTRPNLDRLVALPGGRALYRVRWKVWSGWHLLWDRTPDVDGGERAVLRVAAFCDDMVFAPPDEVATVVRAALLHDTFRPTEPPTRADLDEAERKAELRLSGNPDDLVSIGTSAASGARSTASSVNRTQLNAESGELPDVPQGQGSVRKGKAVYREISPSESLTYLRSIVTPPAERVGRGGPSMLFLFDHSDPGERGDVHELLPLTPYVRTRRREAGVGQVHSAGWVMLFLGGGADPVPLGPDYRPRVAEELELALPRWERPRYLDWTLGLGLGHFPYRRTWLGCAYSATGTWESSVADCDRLQEITGVPTQTPKVVGTTQVLAMDQTEGFGADFQATATWWAHDRPRVGGELGVETRVDVLHAGQSWYWAAPAGSDPGLLDTITYDRAYRFHTGPIVGVRFAPKPPDLWRTVGVDRSRPPVLWGVDQPDGDVNPARYQWGVRAGFLMGPGYNGMEATALAELWTARSLALSRTPAGLMSPYRPLVTTGLFARVQYGDSIGAVPERYLELAGSWTLILGVRTYLRLGSAAPEPPEVEVPE